MEYQTTTHLVKSCNLKSLFKMSGITTRDHNYSYCCAIIMLFHKASQFTLSSCLKELNKIIHETRHHHLSFGISHPYIVFYNIWLITDFYKPEKDKPFIIQPFFLYSFNSGFDNFLLYF